MRRLKEELNVTDVTSKRGTRLKKEKAIALQKYDVNASKNQTYTCNRSMYEHVFDVFYDV